MELVKMTFKMNPVALGGSISSKDILIRSAINDLWVKFDHPDHSEPSLDGPWVKVRVQRYDSDYEVRIAKDLGSVEVSLEKGDPKFAEDDIHKICEVIGFVVEKHSEVGNPVRLKR